MPVKKSAPLPIQILSDDCLFYTMDGKPHNISDLTYGKIRPEQILLTATKSEKTDRFSEPDLACTKDFCRRYFIPELCDALDTYCSLKETPQGIIKLFCLPRESLPQVKNVCKHYRDNNGVEPEERRKMVIHMVEGWLQPITIDTITQDYERMHGGKTDFVKTIMQEVGGKILSNTQWKEFQRLPEWIQVLTHDQGCRIINTTLPGSETGAATLKTYGIMHTCYDLRLRHDLQPLARLMREELVHSLHYNLSHEPLFLKWRMQMKPFYAAMRRSPETSEALALIKRTAPDGGSLMKNPDHAHFELLTDIFDAEIYLRTKDEKIIQSRNPKKATEEKLRHAFGDEIYELSRQFMHTWIEQAANILEKQLSPAETAHGETMRYRKKWEDDPFLHHITLPTRLPHYNLDVRRRTGRE